MGGFGGDLTNYGQTNSLFGKNIQAYYRESKSEYNFSKELEEYDAGSLSVNELLNSVESNWLEDDESTYWVDERVPFAGKDGQTNAYVKRGVDDEIQEPLLRTQANVKIWYFATDDNHIYFKAGSKIYARGREWYLIKVISQDSTSSTTNKYNAMNTDPDEKRLLQFGLKTLVLV